MKTDIEISSETKLLPITFLAEKLKLPNDNLIPFGKYKAKITLDSIDEAAIKKSNLILVTAMSPTKSGVGKTVITVGLSLALNKLGKHSIATLREPSLGPVFGMKGGAAGGGFAQVLPMEDINLHFTGDFHAITAANNTLAALLDNYQFNHIHTDKALKKIVWRRVLDVNDRSLRNIVTGLGGTTNGIPRETGFDITPASEIMAILCLSKDEADLKKRIEQTVLGYRLDNSPFTVQDLGVTDAICLLLKEALLPNLVQTTEQTPAIIHGGPFANIAHGCNSIIATKMAMSLCDYAITEAGFGSDLGAEKFFDIKCRVAGLVPKATVLVITTQALKNHGNCTGPEAKLPNSEALQKGFINLVKHIKNLQSFGQPVIVTLNKFHFDTEKEITLIEQWCTDQRVTFAINDCFVSGGSGGTALAEKVLEEIKNHPVHALHYPYDLNDTIEEKINKIATRIYGAKSIEMSNKAQSAMLQIENNYWGHLPICMDKTQYSFTDDPKISGAPTDHILHIEDLIINAGAGFIVVVAGNIMRMPGLPKQPAAYGMRYNNGKIEGLS